jgi:DNA-binding response OmpR family regulator
VTPALTALIVEVDHAVRETLAQVLRTAGYTVVGYETGEMALAALQTDIVATILVTEVRLPGLDGWQLARAARRLRPGLPILYIPAIDESRALQVPQSFVLSKPFGLRALAMAVRILACPFVTYH